MSEFTQQHSSAGVTDDSDGLEFTETSSLTTDTNDVPIRPTIECNNDNFSDEVEQGNFPVVKQEPVDVCFTILFNTATLITNVVIF